MLVEGCINYIRTLLRGEGLREFEELAIQNPGTTNTHLNLTQEGLLGYFPNQCPFQSEARVEPRNA